MGPTVRVATLIAFSMLLLMTAALSASAAPSAELWPRWQAHDPASTRTLDHSAWTAFLRRYVKTGGGVNTVDYAAVSAADRDALEGYVRALEGTAVSRLARAEQLPYWINLYNALTVRVVLDHYPVDSIREIDISPGLFADGPWGKKLARVEGEQLSLDDIEHRILRPIWRDPRLHYAVNCAAAGCPDLQPRAFTAPNADGMLAAAAHDYVNNPRGVAFIDGKLHVSSIYKWYAEDFGGTEDGVIAHLAKHAGPALRARLEHARGITGYRYDWSLNDARSGG